MQAHSDSSNQSYVDEVMRVVQERFPMGGINRADVGSKLPEEQLKIKLSILKQFEQLLLYYFQDLDSPNKETGFAQLMQTVDFGNCGTLALYGLGYLKNKYPSSKVRIVRLDDHSLLGIGITADINKWDNTMYLCDPWSKKCWLAFDFLKKKMSAPNIPFYSILGIDQKIHSVFINDGFHYLSGNPKVYSDKQCLELEKPFIKWIQEEERLKSKPNLHDLKKYTLFGSETRWQTDLKNLVNDTIKNTEDKTLFHNLIDKNEFNRLLRQSAVSPSAISILEYLLDHAASLKIDVSAAGQQGNALSIAKTRNNDLAVHALESFMKGPNENKAYA